MIAEDTGREAGDQWTILALCGLAAAVPLAFSVALYQPYLPGEPCKCRIRVFGTQRFGATEPTCSVKFGFEPDFAARELKNCDTVEPGIFDRLVTCDSASKAVLYCGDGQTISVGSNDKVHLECRSTPGLQDHIVANGRDPWARTPGSRPPRPALSWLSPGRGNQTAGETTPGRDLITGMVSLRVLSGDAGIVTRSQEGGLGFVTVADGETEIRALCTGDTLRLAGPATLTLLTECDLVDNVAGRWRGGYARQPLDGPFQSVPAMLTLSGPGRFASGGLRTSDGTFAVIDRRFESDSFYIRAIKTYDDHYRQIEMTGSPTKGELMYEVNEIDTTVTPPTTQYARGFLERLYIADSSLPRAVVNQPFSFKLIGISPARGPISFKLSQGRLPTGLGFDETSGTFQGSPSEAGLYDIVVSVTDSNKDVFEQHFNLEVKQLAVTTRLLPDAYAGQPYSFTLSALGGKPPYRWELQAPAADFQLNAPTGELSGHPPRGNTYSTIFLKVTDSEGRSEEDALALIVRGVTILNSQFLPEAEVGVPYRTQFTARGNTSPVAWVMQPSLDEVGLRLNPTTGELSGIPTQAGGVAAFVTVRDGSSDQSRTFILSVRATGAPPGLTNASRHTSFSPIGSLSGPHPVAYRQMFARCCE